MARSVTAQIPYTTLVGHPRAGRQGFVQQRVFQVPLENAPQLTSTTPQGLGMVQGTLLDADTSPIFSGATATITVADNTFTASATLYLGPYSLTSGIDFTVGGTAEDTATALAAAINALPDFSASAVAEDISVTGPFGIVGQQEEVRAVYRGAVENYTLAGSWLTGGYPVQGPMTILR